MALLEQWQKVAYNEKADRGELQRFWQHYFLLEKGVYEKLLANPDEKVEGTVKELADKFTALEAEAEELRKFKAERIDADKDAMIAKYHMLSDEDKAEIIADKDKFTLGEIESKLALLYVQKNVNFDEEEEVDSTPLTTFSLDDETIAEDADPILSALREAQNY